ncbi:HlyD family efflux transporter periplasmic adaptor subunit [Maribrevibacterium harenarium]|uniref:HlyD family efflux transporter periplasmic adaptor subunit n=1 Tax=Maribrevibacterium harenarium TaxID=2589817 RepID=A0A501W9J4_9GAMM|nr:efflux RND transporter periplasmic adaptor subunit [Maribrevibacterium harenarium]TPE46623.1 HlyD family efflux transporter periplasmic adaptor subunit [Maribrevibacterium harenarium]
MSQVNITELINRLRALRKRHYQSAPTIFWADFINIASVLCLAEGANVYRVGAEQNLTLSAESQQEYDSFNQQVRYIAPAEEATWLPDTVIRTLKNGFALYHDKSPLQEKPHWLCFRLTTDEPRVLLLKIPESQAARLSDVVLRGQLIADIATESPSAQQTAPVDRADSLSLLSVLPDMYAADSLALSAYALVNGLVAQCEDIDLAAVGWQRGEYVRMESISHFDNFENKADLVKLYEAALEEAADQQATLHLQHPDTTQGMITLAHEQLRRALGCDDLASMVIFDTQGQPLGSVLVVKMRGEIDANLIHSLSFVLSLLSSRLEDLKRQEGGIWLRVKHRTSQFLSKLFGSDWLWTKVISLILISLFSWLLFGSLSFRIQSNGEFLTDSTQLINSPQDGVVTEVFATVGDPVTENQILIQLEKQDLLLQLTELRAERQRYASEEDKARASNNIIETEIAKARGAQIEARIARVQLMLAETDIRTPISGILIEGERKDLQGAPVRKGDPMMKIARIEGIYLVLSVDERDIHFVEPGDTGEFALVSQPLDPLPFEVEKIIPVAVDGDQGGATFQIKAKLLTPAQPWWRPGMTGVAKIDKGYRPPYWVLGRKSYHQLRLLLWW